MDWGWLLLPLNKLLWTSEKSHHPQIWDRVEQKLKLQYRISKINSKTKQAGVKFLGGFGNFLNSLLSTFLVPSTIPSLGLQGNVKLPDKMDWSQTLTTGIQPMNNAGFHCFVSLSNQFSAWHGCWTMAKPCPLPSPYWILHITTSRGL